MAQIVLRNADNPSAGFALFDETYGWRRWISGPEAQVRGAFAQAGAQLDAAVTMDVSDAVWRAIPELIVQDGYYRIR